MQRAVQQYLSAIGAVAVTTFTVLLAPSDLQQALTPAYLLPVLVGALYGGLGPGIVGSGLSAIAIDYFFTAPYYNLFPITFPECIRLVVYSVLAVVINSLVMARRRADRRSVQARIDSEVADAAERFRTSILNNISHEVRTPLSAILGYGQLLGREGRSADERSVWIASLKQSSAVLIRLVDEMLDLSQFGAGKLEIKKSKVELPPLLHRALAAVSPATTKKGLTVDIIAGSPIPAIIETDPELLVHIMTNVIGNAIKFTDQGFVRVMLHLLKDELEPKLAITVSDSGIGIPEDAIAKLFEPFTQVDSSSARRHGGAGIGLAWSRLIARKLGGDVKLLRSTCGAGSTFEISIATGSLDGVDFMQVLGETGATNQRGAGTSGVLIEGC